MSTAKGDRLKYLVDSRQLLYKLPCDKLFELPGRPNVVYTIKDYSADKVKGAAEARQEVGFLFKAFETGQIGPRRLARMIGENTPRNATIHEYLDWTCTAYEAKDETEYDFSGFRLILLYPRERNVWPAPNGSKPQDRADPRLGAPLDPWPGLHVKGRPLSAATIRSGPGYLEVPFVATHENKRGRGFGRCVVEAIEDVARALGIGRLLLCSTCEEHVQTTWKHLGFVETTDLDLEKLDVRDPDLVHMQNTVQMHKHVPPPRRWRSILIKHEAFVARTYAPLGEGGADACGGGAAGRREETFAVGMTNNDDDGDGGDDGGGGSFVTGISLGGSGGAGLGGGNGGLLGAGSLAISGGGGASLAVSCGGAPGVEASSYPPRLAAAAAAARPGGDPGRPPAGPNPGPGGAIGGAAGGGGGDVQRRGSLPQQSEASSDVLLFVNAGAHQTDAMEVG